ncbi:MULTISPECIES: hypothetical protein [Burkholderia]|jgi:hypothetical protein|uniref:Uncharacterized protein n=2 Tax=Burkholderia ambifaria TaxID=152480 RepID=Q0B650_BURCM|nr:MULTISPECIES: hypothetical protein [Burkholderia]ABI90373.1 conserved hypothetical protein [Burkholderia ambifaria AMMD]ACB67814.1 conserved hypothetical protein [Burkholderia ambifaria MC40-6]AJY24010.1 hypothetical protein CH72_4863 [Burkholderia ambifaria AMMD]MBR7931852.1 hypothetical protein [Burkholderia ambifaria]MBR8062105.1 hypothetical protein [Burkholderia ambifaria]
MSTLEALRFVLDDARTPEIIRHHVVDALQYALRNYGQVFTAKEIEWLAQWDDARLPLAAKKELDKREPAIAAR